MEAIIERTLELCLMRYLGHCQPMSFEGLIYELGRDNFDICPAELRDCLDSLTVQGFLEVIERGFDHPRCYWQVKVQEHKQ